MSEEQPQGLYATHIEQLDKLQAENVSLKRTNEVEFRSGFFVGGVVVGAIAWLFSSCDGCNLDYETFSINNSADAGTYDAGKSDAGITDASLADADTQSCSYSGKKSCKTGQDCYDVNFVDGLESRLMNCLAEKQDLSRQLKNCKAYTPIACPPVKECPTAPYIRRGN